MICTDTQRPETSTGRCRIGDPASGSFALRLRLIAVDRTIRAAGLIRLRSEPEQGGVLRSWCDRAGRCGAVAPDYVVKYSVRRIANVPVSVEGSCDCMWTISVVCLMAEC